MKFACAIFLCLVQVAYCLQCEYSRKVFLGRQAAATLIAFGATNAQPSSANAATPPTAAEIEKLRKGHSRIKFLLENWDSETQVCGKITMSDTERKQVVRTEGKLENSGTFPPPFKVSR